MPNVSSISYKTKLPSCDGTPNDLIHNSTCISRLSRTPVLLIFLLTPLALPAGPLNNIPYMGRDCSRMFLNGIPTKITICIFHSCRFRGNDDESLEFNAGTSGANVQNRSAPSPYCCLVNAAKVVPGTQTVSITKRSYLWCQIKLLFM